MHAPNTPNFLTSDPQTLADRVARRELRAAIRWTEVYLRGLRDRLDDHYRQTPPESIDILQMDTDCDLATSRLRTYGQRLADPSPAGHPPEEPDTLDINLAEHSRLIDRARDLSAAAMDRFHQLHDSQITADGDDHFDRQGHEQESDGL